MPAKSPTFKKPTAYLIIFVLLAVTFMPSIVNSQDLSTIKVMLLSGKTAYEQLITVSSTNSLTISTNAAIPYTIQSKQNEQLGIQLDRNQLQLLETTDINQAKSVISKIEQLSDVISPRIQLLNINNKTIYRVIAGSFATLEELNQVNKLILEKTQINGKAIGSLHWSLGEFNTIDEANTKLNELTSNGFQSYLVQVFANGKWGYQVFVGESITSEEHQNLKNAIQLKFPNLNLLEVNQANYVIYKQTAYLKNGQLNSYQLLSFSTPTSISIKAKDANSTILINERSYQGKANYYRGDITIQLYDGVLALVNTLSFEEYLYSVVGSEVYTSWHIEALKAQAVAARTFAYSKILSPRNSIAHIYDTVDDQAYYGVFQEADKVIQAVDETKGYVVLSNNKPISTFYSSNAGGMTAAGAEVWGNNIPYTSVKSSDFDSAVLDTTISWYHIIRANGQSGYIRNDLIDVLNKNYILGLPYGVINTDGVNFRTGPSVARFPVITVLPQGEEIVILETVYENNPYSWIAGPITADYMRDNVNKYQLATSQAFTKPLLDLQVVERGPSGRVTLIADGKNSIPVKYPDYYRTLFGGLATGVQSTLFEIEQLGRVEVLGANGSQNTIINNKEGFSVISATGIQPLTAANYQQGDYLILGNEDKLRLATKDQSYLLRGTGFGHGIGMSQWGAKGLADFGYSYQEILKYYYNNVDIKQIYQ